MITPRSTRLLKVADLPGLHAALAAVVDRVDVLAARRCAVIVPTTGAAEALRRTLEGRLGRGGAMVLPDIVTRGDFYSRLHEQLPGAAPRLSDFEREVILRRAARSASDSGFPAPFRLRARLIAAILGFYDELRRNGRQVSDFERLVVESLEPSAEMDRGAERLLRQTRFLVATFEGFEARVRDTGRLDEHRLREALFSSVRPAGYSRVVVTVADQAGDRHGLWEADFDLLTRAPGFSQIDVIATSRVLDTGFEERLRDRLPGLAVIAAAEPAGPPLLLMPEPPPGEPGSPWFVSRDREEELADVVRAVHAAPDGGRIGVVYQRPLPYLYLARMLFPDAGVPYQALDTLPLAAEPFAAALDLVFEVALSAATRASLVAVLRSPHWRFDETSLAGEDVSAFDAWLLERRFLGGWDAVASLAPDALASPSRRRGQRGDAARAGAAARRAAEAIRGIVEAPTASQQFRGLVALVVAHEVAPGEEGDDPRHARARAAILGALDGLAEAHAGHDDEPLLVTDLAGAVRRWIEGQTFAPSTGAGGVALFDAPAAPYADLDEVRLLGLVESDWPDRPARSIFYPASLLALLGWPGERSRLSTARARFQDLLRLARQRVAISTFTLEDDAVVAPSAFLEDIETAGLPVARVPRGPAPLVFAQEAMRLDPSLAMSVGGDRGAWLAFRDGRTAGTAAVFHGEAGLRRPGLYAVSRLDRYLECPFKYYAAHVLRLEEESAEAAGLTPLERGQFLHTVFEEFFSTWETRGGGPIGPGDLDAARALFAEVAERRLATLPETERALERTHLLGSAAAPGLADRLIALEIEQAVPVRQRLLEHSLEGRFSIAGADGPVRLHLRGKADRIDLLADGTLRIVDYKLGRAPKTVRALQLPAYAAAASQALEARDGRPWPVSWLGYVALRERNAFTPLGASPAAMVQAMADGQQRLIDTVAAIEQGHFPVDPDEPFMCTRCGFAGVCRKDYVGDE